MQAKLKQAQETQKQQLLRLSGAIRNYGRKRSTASRVSDVDVDLQRYILEEAGRDLLWQNVPCCRG